MWDAKTITEMASGHRKAIERRPREDLGRYPAVPSSLPGSDGPTGNCRRAGDVLMVECEASLESRPGRSRCHWFGRGRVADYRVTGNRGSGGMSVQLHGERGNCSFRLHHELLGDGGACGRPGSLAFMPPGRADEWFDAQLEVAMLAIGNLEAESELPEWTDFRTENGYSNPFEVSGLLDRLWVPNHPCWQNRAAGAVVMHRTLFTDDREAWDYFHHWFGQGSKGYYRISELVCPDGHLSVTAEFTPEPDGDFTDSLRLFESYLPFGVIPDDVDDSGFEQASQAFGSFATEQVRLALDAIGRHAHTETPRCVENPGGASGRPGAPRPSSPSVKVPGAQPR